MEPVQVGEGAFHHPASSPETGAVRGAAAGDDRLGSEGPHEAVELVVVVAAVAEHESGSSTGPARAYLARAGLHRAAA